MALRLAQKMILGVLFLATLLIAQVGTEPVGEGPGDPPLGLDLYVPVLPENRSTRARALLGRRLFFDPLLSADRSVACSSCHQPDRGFADATATSQGVLGRRTSRNAPSLLNAAYGEFFFWDGRIQTLERQVVEPITNPNEMGLPLEELAARLRSNRAYDRAFRDTFGAGPSPQNLALALASYVRTLRSGNSAADRYVHGDSAALGADARAGLRLFQGKARCIECHTGPLITDGLFHNTGVGWGGDDVGRSAITGDPADRGKFKTPSLRNVVLTAPYMHDGSLKTLEEVIDFYDKGAQNNPNIDPEIRPLRLSSEEKNQLIAYLRSLTGSSTPQ